jgi:Ca-activated chloride channel family protein
MSNTTKSLLAILTLILATTAALAAMGAMGAPPAPALPSGDDRVAISTEVVQDKILKGGDGRVTVALELTAARLPSLDNDPPAAADLVIVLDRSGSMEGAKLRDARLAVMRLLDQLNAEDRLALVTYANDVRTQAPLMSMNAANRRRMASIVEQVFAGGGTNLGGGLERGIDTLMQAPTTDRQRKVILISDGLANQGITDPKALGRMASAAVENYFSISTVGVGLDFNETLMTAIADQGAGSYHFLENPGTFAQVFDKELKASRQVAATDVGIHIPLVPGVRLVSAGGYPIRYEAQTAVVHPGNLMSGQHKSLYLTFQVPTGEEKRIDLGRVHVQYRHDGRLHTVDGSWPLTVACVSNPKDVLASIKKESWAEQVVKEEFNQLKEAVAAEIREGNKEKAQSRIEEYEAKQAAINTVVGSGRVAENLETEVRALREQVDETFAGPPAAVVQKQKQASKSLQYDSYRMRRDKN